MKLWLCSYLQSILFSLKNPSFLNMRIASGRGGGRKIYLKYSLFMYTEGVNVFYTFWGGVWEAPIGSSRGCGYIGDSFPTQVIILIYPACIVCYSNFHQFNMALFHVGHNKKESVAVPFVHVWSFLNIC